MVADDGAGPELPPERERAEAVQGLTVRRCTVGDRVPTASQSHDPACSAEAGQGVAVEAVALGVGGREDAVARQQS